MPSALTGVGVPAGARRAQSAARRWLAGVVVGCVAALGAALVTQHVFGMQPCPWCTLQRLILVAMALAALPGALLAVPAARFGSGLLVLAGALAGMAAALWQHLVASASSSCNLTFADRVMGATGLDAQFPAVFAAYSSCADAKVNLLGVPYEFWSLALFAGMGLVALTVLLRRR